MEQNVLFYSTWNMYLLQHYLQKCSKIENCCELKLSALSCNFILSQNNAVMRKEWMFDTGRACFYQHNTQNHQTIFIQHNKSIVLPNVCGYIGGGEGLH